MMCLLCIVTIIANIGLILLALYISQFAYGSERFFALILAIPPLLSLIVIRSKGDREERLLKKRIRKALLRKELDELKQFDKEQ
ncbi:MAG: hypothetical protein ACRBDL_04590 [Alphaproteobacteria bacterium]